MQEQSISNINISNKPISTEALTTGRMIPQGLIVHRQRYRPSDSNKDVVHTMPFVE
jgi:hypothetical protein